LTEHTLEGSLYRVDIRLRAEGTVGRLTRSLDEYVAYYRTRGQVWERLALLKAWPVAGSMEVGRSFVRRVRPFVLAPSRRTPDVEGALSTVREVRAVKERIDARMTERGQARSNVKLGTGGIREIEFLVQTIQVLAGKRVPAVLDRSTLGALERLGRLKLITAKEKDGLAAAYLFLRDVEHKLQMVDGFQTHALPERDEELKRFAVRMGYGGDRRAALERFQADHRAHIAFVHGLFRSFFDNPKKSPVFKAALGGR
jgi:glutamate-ammonia-ligase adenylyltransferase